MNTEQDIVDHQTIHNEFTIHYESVAILIIRPWLEDILTNVVLLYYGNYAILLCLEGISGLPPEHLHRTPIILLWTQRSGCL